MRIAFVYDRVNKIGGAERVLQQLHQIWPDAPLYTSVYNPNTAAWAKKFTVIPSFLQHLPFTRTRHEWLAWAMPYAFESFNFDQYDVVISVTSAEAKGIITKPSTLHICYLLTPTRYLWSHTHQYQNHSKLHQFPITRPFSSYLLQQLRLWDQVAAQRPDRYLAISHTVKFRTEKYYRRQVDQVIYPPTFSHPTNSQALQTEDFFLLVSRLVPYKRVDLAVKAFNYLNKNLVVIGIGSEYEKIRQIANSNVRMVGKLTQAQLISYYQRCRALIFPAEEDFGLVSLEAQSFGKPVIAYGRGGASETVINNITGILYYKQTQNSLIRAINKLDKLSISSQKCRANARKFSSDKFKIEFVKYVEEQWQIHQKSQI